jgi:hypothetical protein
MARVSGLTAVESRDTWHGTVGGYTNHSCRCDDCRAAMKAARVARHSRPIPSSVEHGRAGTYTNYGCRCDDCRVAHTASQRQGRAARRSLARHGTKSR